MRTMTIPMVYQLAMPMRLNQSGMKPPANGRGSPGSGVAAAASGASGAPPLLNSFTLTPC